MFGRESGGHVDEATSLSDTLSGAGERRPAFSRERVALVYMVGTFFVFGRGKKLHGAQQ